MQTLFIATAFCMLVSYALCGIPFGVIVGRLFCGEDVRQKGSGNIGMTNVARVAGKKAAALTFLCDVGKAVCAMLIARCVLMPLCMQLSVSGLSADITAELAGVPFGSVLVSMGCTTSALLFEFLLACNFAACVIGHIFSIYLHFKGGKGIAVGFGACLVLNWPCALCAIGGFFIVVIPTKTVSIGSVVAAISIPIWAYVWGIHGASLVPMCFVALLVLWAHRSNIARLLAGKEQGFCVAQPAAHAASADDVRAQDEPNQPQPNQPHSV